MSKRVLVIGATGAMGQYLVPKLSELGYEIDALALDDPRQSYPNVTYYKANFKEKQVHDTFLAKNYDGIVDFMTYHTAEIATELPLLASSTGHYIYLSSCRVFANEECPIKESSPRLLDVSKDEKLLASDDYCMYKARGEDVLRSLPCKSWTIVRPSTTFSFMRYQLVTLEAADTVGRAFRGKTVVLPVQAYSIPSSMTWGGDVASMLANLLFNERALGEDFNVTSAEWHPWSEVADYYKEICNLHAIWVDKEEYLRILDPEIRLPIRWQLEYARLFNRAYDNTKMLDVTGLKQEQFKTLFDGLSYEISRCPKDHPFRNHNRMDDYLEQLITTPH